jgi:hypothetical protein
MASYRLRLEGLRHFDTEMFKVYLNYVGGKTGINWSLSEDADAELLLCQASPSRPQRPPAAAHVAWILDPTSPDLGEALVLRRPFHLEEFSALLRCVEGRLASAALTPPPPVARPPHPAPPPEAGSGTASTEPAVCWRLTRWPDRHLLSGHPMFPRLAGFLAARPLDSAQLSRLSGLNRSLCQQFVQVMADAGLLMRSQGSAASAAQTPRPKTSPANAMGSPSAPHPMPPQTGSLGLISRLRAHLGMT